MTIGAGEDQPTIITAQAQFQALLRLPYLVLTKGLNRDRRYGTRCLYITLKSYFNGDNNGRIYLSVRKAAQELGASPSSTEKWFHLLIQHGFIVPTRGGFLGSDGKGTATSWRLTEIGFMGEQPTKDYKDWPNIKNRIPSQKSVQTVPKIVTVRPKNRDGCTEKRDGFTPKSPYQCP